MEQPAGRPQARAVIDLDAAAPEPSPRRRSTGAGWLARRRWVTPGRWPTAQGWVALLTVAVLVTAALGWQARTRGTSLDRLATLPAGAMRLVADPEHLYVMRGDTAAPWTVTAYDWEQGVRRWGQPLSGTDGNLFVVGGAVFEVHQPCSAWNRSSVGRLDARSGDRRWQASDSLLGTLSAAGTRTLLVGQSGSGCGVNRRVGELKALDLETGAARWVLSAGPQAFLAIADGELPWLAVWFADGNVRSYDAVTGRALGSAVFPEVGQAPPGGVRVVGDVLLVVTPATEGATLSAYRRDTLAPIWRRAVPPGDLHPLAQVAYLPPVTGCGPMLCLLGDGRFAVLDLATGQPAWRHEALSNAVYGSGVLLGERPGDDAAAVVLDWRTGRVLADLPGWRVVPTFDTTATTTALLQRPTGGGAELRTVDLDSGRVRPVGTVAAAPSRCVVGPRRMACVDGDDDGRVGMWRLPG